MAAYVDLFDAATDTSLISPSVLAKQTTVAVAVAAYGILSESGGTTNHANRLIWAKQALKTAYIVGQQVLWGVLQNDTIVAAGDANSDATIQTEVDGLVNTYAG